MINWFINSLNSNSGAIQGIAMVVLVGITAYYAIQTRKTAEEMESARKNSVLPIITILGGEWWEDETKNKSFIEFVLKNIGYGPALNLQLEIIHQGKNYLISQNNEDLSFTRPSQLMFILSQEKVKSGRIQETRITKNSISHLKIKYRDIYNDSICTHQAFKIEIIQDSPVNRIGRLILLPESFSLEARRTSEGWPEKIEHKYAKFQEIVGIKDSVSINKK